MRREGARAPHVASPRSDGRVIESRGTETHCSGWGKCLIRVKKAARRAESRETGVKGEKERERDEATRQSGAARLQIEAVHTPGINAILSVCTPLYSTFRGAM